MFVRDVTIGRCVVVENKLILIVGKERTITKGLIVGDVVDHDAWIMIPDCIDLNDNTRCDVVQHIHLLF